MAYTIKGINKKGKPIELLTIANLKETKIWAKKYMKKYKITRTTHW